MVKRGVGNNNNNDNLKRGGSKVLIHVHPKHPVFRQKWTFGQRIADKIADFGGSWTFIIFFFVVLTTWILLNTVLLYTKYDPYPFILLNLVLSCLAAIQAPVILMAQNRQAERDRIHAHYDYQVNRKAEREIKNMQKDLDELKDLLFTHHAYVKHGKK